MDLVQRLTDGASRQARIWTKPLTLTSGKIYDLQQQAGVTPRMNKATFVTAGAGVDALTLWVAGTPAYAALSGQYTEDWLPGLMFAVAYRWAMGRIGEDSTVHWQEKNTSLD